MADIATLQSAATAARAEYERVLARNLADMAALRASRKAELLAMATSFASAQVRCSSGLHSVGLCLSCWGHACFCNRLTATRSCWPRALVRVGMR